MIVVLHLDYGVCDSLFGQFIPHHPFDPSVNLREEEMHCKASGSRLKAQMCVSMLAQQWSQSKNLGVSSFEIQLMTHGVYLFLTTDAD